MKRLIACFGMLLLLNIAVPAFAKIDPYIEDGDWSSVDAPFAVWDNDAAIGLFGKLGVYGDVDAFSYTFDAANEDWDFDVLVPSCGPHFEAAYPSAALIGPGLPAPTANALPFEVPDGMGVQIFTPQQVEPRKVASTNDVNIAIPIEVYESERYTVDIPEAGTYTLALWEPEGHIGAYVLSSGSDQDKFGDRTDAQLQAAFDGMMDGVWLDQNCSLPLAAASCPASPSKPADQALVELPLGWDIGDGFALTGIVRDAATCLPIADAEISFWMPDQEGAYEGRLITNQQGGYRIESARPAPSPDSYAHIHMAVEAPGYGLVMTEYLLSGKDGELVTFDISIAPQES